MSLWKDMFTEERLVVDVIFFLRGLGGLEMICFLCALEFPPRSGKSYL